MFMVFHLCIQLFSNVYIVMFIDIDIFAIFNFVFMYLYFLKLYIHIWKLIKHHPDFVKYLIFHNELYNLIDPFHLNYFL